MQDEHGVFVDAISPTEQHRYPGEYTIPLYAAPPAAPADLTPFEADLLESIGQMKRREGVQVHPPAIDGFGGNLDEAFELAPAPADMVMVPKELVGNFPEINPNSYDHEDVCAMNDWGINLVFAAAPALAVPDGMVEAIAKAIYYEWRRDTGYVPWVDGGNSNKQDDARKIARAVIAGAAPAVREPLIDEMDAVASKYAHKLALDLECVLSDYNGKWWDTAMNTIGEYRMAMNRIHERESPTHMGEPVLPKHGIRGGGK